MLTEHKKHKRNLQKPLIMAHAGGMEHHKENTLQSVQESLKYNVDIIELDIRKSKDGVLFCYHGFGIFVYYIAYFLRFFEYKTISKKFHIDNPLIKILDAIKTPKIVYLNLKDFRVSAQEIDDLHSKYPHLELWIGMSSSKKIKEIRQKLKHNYEFHSTWPNIMSFNSALKNAIKNDLHSIKLLPWQCTPQNLKIVEEHNLYHVLEPILISNKKFAILNKKIGGLYICLNDLRKPHDVTSIYKYL